MHPFIPVSQQVTLPVRSAAAGQWPEIAGTPRSFLPDTLRLTRMPPDGSPSPAGRMPSTNLAGMALTTAEPRRPHRTQILWFAVGLPVALVHGERSGAGGAGTLHRAGRGAAGGGAGVVFWASAPSSGD